MSELDKLSPLERLQVQKLMDQIRVDLQKALPMDAMVSDINTEELANAVLNSVNTVFPNVLSVVVTASDVPNVLDVTFHGNLPQSVNLNMNNTVLQYQREGQNTIKDYFDDEVEYPKDIAENPLPLGTLYSYVSSTFLNGFINYVSVIDAFVLHRYTELGKDMTEHLEGKTYQEPAGSNKWTKFPTAITKGEVIDLMSQPRRLSGTDLNIFDDDVILLARTKTDTNVFYFFWFDCDVSDCMIGRFRTEDSQEIVIDKFRNFVRKLSFGHRELPLHFFSDWMFF